MNQLQKQILNIIQAQFPIVLHPFAALANQVNSKEAEIIRQINQLKQTGIIRRIGAVFNAAHLGYVSTLVGAQVPPEKLNAFVADVNAIPGVSHNYGRDHIYNIWFTLTVPGQKIINQTIERLRQNHNIAAVYSLPAEKRFKMRVYFDFLNRQNHDKNNTITDSKKITPPCLSDLQISLIRQLQQDLPIISRPFHVIAENIDADINFILQQIIDWKSSGLMRRFGAVIRHQQAGFNANGMVVFEVDPKNIDTSGHLLAAYPQVSHCYQRPTVPDWPYNLFAMTHCESEPQLRDLVKGMVAQIKPKQYDILLSTQEYKKTNVKYFLEKKRCPTPHQNTSNYSPRPKK